jgi:hypothetical protein
MASKEESPDSFQAHNAQRQDGHLTLADNPYVGQA